MPTVSRWKERQLHLSGPLCTEPEASLESQCGSSGLLFIYYSLGYDSQEANLENQEANLSDTGCATSKILPGAKKVICYCGCIHQ